MNLTFKLLKDEYSILKLAADADIPDWASKGEFHSITRTPDELSIVCALPQTDSNITAEHGWKALKIDSKLDFSLVGILANVSSVMANSGISIFAISTYDTDYILLKKENLNQAIKLLSESGHSINS